MTIFTVKGNFCLLFFIIISIVIKVNGKNKKLLLKMNCTVISTEFVSAVDCWYFKNLQKCCIIICIAIIWYKPQKNKLFMRGRLLCFTKDILLKINKVEFMEEFFV
jgi:hypothetical protein